MPAPQQQQQPAKPNPWTTNRASLPASSLGNLAAQSPPPPSSSTGTSTPTHPEDKYVPVGGFNADEVSEWMKSSYQSATAGDTTGAGRWKASPVSSEGKAGAPKAAWGQKPSLMANGQDFWVQLKKQIAAGPLGG